jgi:hypothetical protein
VLADEPVPPARLQPQVPRDLETICLKCLDKDPGRRYGSAQALADDLGRFQLGEPVRARPIGPLGRGWRWCKRNRAVAALLAAVFGVLLAGAAVASVFAVLADQRARAEEKARQDADAARIQAELDNERARKAEALAVRKADEEEKARKEEEKQRGRAEKGEKRASEEEERAKQEVARAEKQ